MKIGRIPITDVGPVVSCGRWPARAVVGETVTITRHGEPVAQLVPLRPADERERRRALVDEIKRWRVGKDRGAKPGSTIPQLIKAGRRY